MTGYLIAARLQRRPKSGYARYEHGQRLAQLSVVRPNRISIYSKRFLAKLCLTIHESRNNGNPVTFAMVLNRMKIDSRCNSKNTLKIQSLRSNRQVPRPIENQLSGFCVDGAVWYAVQEHALKPWNLGKCPRLGRYVISRACSLFFVNKYAVQKINEISFAAHFTRPPQSQWAATATPAPAPVPRPARASCAAKTGDGEPQGGGGSSRINSHASSPTCPPPSPLRSLSRPSSLPLPRRRFPAGRCP